MDDSEPCPANPHEIEGATGGRPPVGWRKERISGSGEDEIPLNAGEPDTASPGRPAPILALRRAGNRPENGCEWVKWWRRGGSNSRPRHCERRALPTELHPHSDDILAQSWALAKPLKGRRACLVGRCQYCGCVLLFQTRERVSQRLNCDTLPQCFVVLPCYNLGGLTMDRGFCVCWAWVCSGYGVVGVGGGGSIVCVRVCDLRLFADQRCQQWLYGERGLARESGI